ncbi:protein kinase domain-containing protein [Paraglaciecola aestuariivivens]
MTDHTKTPSDENDLATQSLCSAAQLSSNHVLVNRFKIVAALGQGAQGNVYHAYDQLLEVDVAIKVIQNELQDFSHLTIIRNEVLLARQLQHKNIIPIFDVFEDQGLVFFTMEYIQGEPLIKRIGQPITQTEFELWTAQLISALKACETAQIKHGDIKPDNILIDHQNNLRLIDFGIGQNIHSSVQAVSGHQDFSAPEVLYGGQSGIQSELFSAGKTIQLMLASVKLTAWSLANRFWQAKQQKFANKLCHVNPLKRPTLNQASDFYHQQSSISLLNGLMLSGLAVALVLLVWGLIKFDWISNQEQALPADTLQISLLHDGKSPLVQNLIDLFELPLSTNPQLSVITSNSIQQSNLNLGLNPSTIAEDRVTLASLYNLQALIVLSVNNIQGDDFLMRASVYAMPANKSVLEISQSVNANQLEADLTEFAGRLFSQLEVRLAEQFDDSEVALFSSGLATLGQPTVQTGEQTLTPDFLAEQTPGYAGAWYQAALNAWQQGDVQAAQEHLSMLFELGTSSSYWRLQARLLQAEMNDDLSLAQQSIQQLTDGFPDRADLLAKQAEIHEWAGDYASAIADYQQALELLPNNAKHWFELARLKIISGDSQSAIENELTRALVIYRKNNDLAGEGLVLNAFGIAHLRRAEYDIAEKYLTDTLALYDRQNYPLERVKSLANLATVDSLNGQYAKAKTALEEALDILREVGDTARQAHVIDTLGILHEEQGLYNQALDYYKRALDLRSALGDDIEKALSMSNVAFMHFLIGDFSLADIYWQQAKALFDKNNEQSHLQRTIQNLAQLSLAKGDHLKASRFLTQVSGQLDTSQKQEVMINKLLYSYLNFAEGALSNALTNLEEARQLAKQTEDSRALTEVNLWHGEICLRIADLACLQANINQASTTIAENMTEHQALLSWLKYSSELFDSKINAIEPLDFVQNIIQANIPVMTEMKILLDIQERLNLSADSLSMQRLKQIVKPIYYQQYMHLLFLQSDDQAARQALHTQLLSHPKYWRNHLYYSVFDDQKSQLKLQQLQAEWFAKLNEQQAKRYQEQYFEF